MRVHDAPQRPLWWPLSLAITQGDPGAQVGPECSSPWAGINATCHPEGQGFTTLGNCLCVLAAGQVRSTGWALLEFSTCSSL